MCKSIKPQAPRHNETTPKTTIKVKGNCDCVAQVKSWEKVMRACSKRGEAAALSNELEKARLK